MNRTSDMLNWLKRDFNAALNDRENRDEHSGCVIWEYVELDLMNQHWDKMFTGFKDLFNDLVHEYENSRQPEFA